MTTDRRNGLKANKASKSVKPRKAAKAPARPYVPAIARIEQVRSALGEILQWQHPADQALSRWMRGHTKMGARDRAEVTEAVFNVLRHLRRYRNLAESGTGPAARRLAILGLDATLGTEALQPSLEDQERVWLEHIRRIDLRAMPRAVRESLPDWLDERLGA